VCCPNAKSNDEYERDNFTSLSQKRPGTIYPDSDSNSGIDFTSEVVQS